MSLCANATQTKHELPGEGGRRVTLGVEWGAADLRDNWEGDYVFCDFRCLAAKAVEWACEHDGHVLREGVG